MGIDLILHLPGLAAGGGDKGCQCELRKRIILSLKPGGCTIEQAAFSVLLVEGRISSSKGSGGRGSLVYVLDGIFACRFFLLSLPF